VQPQDVLAHNGGNAQFNVGVGAAVRSAVTYQWRKGFVNLVNGGRISGATTNALTISAVDSSDVGIYDVVVTQGAASEPSRMARLTLGGTTGIDAQPPNTDSPMLGMPVPNPCRSETSLQYSLSKDSHVLIDVFDVRGRRVRTLVDQSMPGPATYDVQWNGRDSSGAVSAPGVYFVRMVAEDRGSTRRVVLSPRSR
jgi:hypothetical protein